MSGQIMSGGGKGGGVKREGGSECSTTRGASREEKGEIGVREGYERVCVDEDTACMWG